MLCDYCNKMKISYIHQFFVGYHSYDFRINNSKIIMEINGDYWHCNPKFYSPNTKVNFGNTQMKAKDKWLIDKHKKSVAQGYGYKVKYLWENEINKMTDEELSVKIKKIIKGS